MVRNLPWILFKIRNLWKSSLLAAIWNHQKYRSQHILQCYTAIPSSISIRLPRECFIRVKGVQWYSRFSVWCITNYNKPSSHRVLVPSSLIFLPISLVFEVPIHQTERTIEEIKIIPIIKKCFEASESYYI